MKYHTPTLSPCARRGRCVETVVHSQQPLVDVTLLYSSSLAHLMIHEGILVSAMEKKMKLY
jgi:hypothetical protein